MRTLTVSCALMLVFCSYMPSELVLDTQHSFQSNHVQCDDMSALGDCDGDFIQNFEEDINQDGDYLNDDTDQDSIPDFMDADDDGDGWPTWLECPIAEEDTVQDCPGFGPVKDYLHPKLFNCDLPIIQLGHASPKKISFLAHIDHNSSLVEIGQIEGESTGASDRSNLNGNLYYVYSNNSNLLLANWNPLEGKSTEEDSINSSSGFNRFDFLSDATLGFQSQGSTIIHQFKLDELEFSSYLTLNRTTGSGGDMVIDENEIYFFSANGDIFNASRSSGSVSFLGNVRNIDGASFHQIKGATTTSNGSLYFNSGENLYVIDGQWTEGIGSDGLTPSGGQLFFSQLATSSDSTTGGDMLTCQLDLDDDDVDDIPNHFETHIFLTNSSNPDTDDDGINDGLEILQYQTNPLSSDSDGDGCYDGDEILNGTNPLAVDTNEDGILDCIVPTSLSYSESLYSAYVDQGFPIINPQVQGEVPATWSIEPNLPTHLQFSSGSILLIEPQSIPLTTFTVYADGPGGNVSSTISIEFLHRPPSIAYPQSTYIFEQFDEVIIQAESTGGDIISWNVSISSTTDAGLDFDEGNFSGFALHPGTYDVQVTAEGHDQQLSITSFTLVVDEYIDNTTEDEKSTDAFCMSCLVTEQCLLPILLFGIIATFMYFSKKEDDDDQIDEQINELENQIEKSNS